MSSPTLYERIRHFRRDAGFTQLQVAERLQVTPTTVNSWEPGGTRQSAPRWPHMQKLWDLFGISGSQFFGPLRGEPEEPGNAGKYTRGPARSRRRKTGARK